MLQLPVFNTLFYFVFHNQVHKHCSKIIVLCKKSQKQKYIYLINMASCATSKISVNLSRANEYHCPLCTSACSCFTRSLANLSAHLVLVCRDNGTDCSLSTMSLFVRKHCLCNFQHAKLY